MKNQLSRHDFIKLVGLSGGGLVLAIYLDACAQISKETATATSAISSATPTITVTPLAPTAASTPTAPAPDQPFDWAPHFYLVLDNTGTLTVLAFRSEMGQGIRTALAMLVADELDVAWEHVRIEQAPTNPRYGNQLTGGSVSISSYYKAARTAGAVARQMLIQAAAQAWSVDPAQCQTDAGSVIHPDGQQKSAYTDLLEAASRLKAPLNPPLKDKTQWKIIGQEVGHWDAQQIVTGKAVFGLDVRLPGMLFAVLARCPVLEGKLVSYDDVAAKAVPGVRHIFPIGDKIAVVAEHTWAAIQGRNALVIQWDEGQYKTLSSEGMRKNAVDGFPKPGSTANVLDAIYEIPYEAHATMEPMNSTAYVHDGTCEIWSPTQNPQAVWQQVSTETGIPQNKVTVHVTLLGGGFGRRLGVDYAVEAALVSKEISAPVQLVWTREDDLQHDTYHNLTILYASAPLNRAVLPRISTARGSHLPTGPWRSVDNFPSAYATECFLDEMAVSLKRDPLDLHLELYSGPAAAVIKLAAEKAEWSKPLPNGWGKGLAYFATWGATHVAYVAEVSVDADGKVRVQRVVAAVDCGQAVNPDNIRAQIEGGIAFALTATLKAEATLKDGRIQQSNYHDYPLLRLDEMPQVEVYIVESDRVPTGMGEMGVPPLAPAVANAVFAATGKRIRHIPIRAEDLKA